MHPAWLRAALLSVLAVSSWAQAAQPADTAHLAAQVRAVRGRDWLKSAEYAPLKAQFLEWIDARVLAGRTIESMNRELKAAGLLLDPPKSADQYSTEYTGKLGGVSAQPVRGAGDLLAINAGISRGSTCHVDITVILYQREPLRRLAHINAELGDGDFACYLSGLAAGEKDASGARLIASGWVYSNCTSVWNGKRIRIDRLKASSVENILARSLSARDREAIENVAPWVRGDVVTFWYEGGLPDAEMMSTPAIARYRVAENRAVREPPMALTRAGFIEEWLAMEDSEAARWSEPEALRVHQAVAAAFHHDVFKWEHIGRCAGSPPVWEIGVRLDKSKKLYVFRIHASRATDLRMLAVTDHWTSSCADFPLASILQTLGTELPW
jgi:hypothetical protein